jgi:hypothetical protein
MADVRRGILVGLGLSEAAIASLPVLEPTARPELGWIGLRLNDSRGVFEAYEWRLSATPRVSTDRRHGARAARSVLLGYDLTMTFSARRLVDRQFELLYSDGGVHVRAVMMVDEMTAIHDGWFELSATGVDVVVSQLPREEKAPEVPEPEGRRAITIKAREGV